MSRIPRFQSPDGELREDLLFSTTIPNKFLNGEVSGDAIGIEVSIRGGEFTSNPDLIQFGQGSFLIPNPSAFPEGLDLLSGDNEVRVRALYLDQAPTESTAVIRFSPDFEGVNALPPGGIRAERFKKSVEITVEDPRLDGGFTLDRDVSGLIGFNFYASTQQGGGDQGYARININPIRDFSEIPFTESLGVLSTLFPFAEEGQVTLRLVGTQEQEGQVLETSFNEFLEINPTDTGTQIRVRAEVSEEIPRRFTRFLHNRRAGPTDIPATVFVGEFSALPDTQPLYYVATAVYFDPSRELEVESSFSAEVSAKPSEITPEVSTIPSVDRDQIIQDMVLGIFRSRPDIKVEPGSVARDIALDPFSSEAERLRFLIDFLYRASSFPTLLQIDDPRSTGFPVPVSDSVYKQALGQALFLTNDNAVQNVIDRAFEKLASNYGVPRRPGRRARGEFVFFLTRIPDRTFNIPLGTTIPGPVDFRTLRAASIPAENPGAFFNPTNGRYEVRVPVESTVPGEIGNIIPGQIDAVVNGLRVTNEARTFGGLERDSNLTLAERAINRLSSVDAGTIQGYYTTAVNVPGVIDAQVIEAGNPLMQRDYDPVAKIHRGGKVDVWVQGQSSAPVSETFAFTFETARDIRFEPIGDLAALEFRAIDSSLSPTNPLAEMLNRPDLNLGLRNISTGFEFDLTDVEITGPDTIRLSQDVPQPTVNLTDVVLGDYRYRTGVRYVFQRQPVSEITRITLGQNTIIPPANYRLVRPNSPLKEGRSTKAGEFVIIEEQIPGELGLDNFISVTGEPHILTGATPDFLNRLGGLTLSIRVFNEDRTVEYRGPFDPSGTSDFTIIEGTQTQPSAIVRTQGSEIESGQTVVVDYDHSQNLTVQYRTNLVVSVVQDEFESMRHTTADVLAKEAVPNQLDISATVVLERGASRPAVDGQINEDIRNFLNRFRGADPIRPSDIVGIIEEVRGVSHVIEPLTKLVRAPGSLVVRERVASAQVGDTRLIPQWSSQTVGTWLIRQPLQSSTTTGGGPPEEFVGVFRDDDEIPIQTVAPSTLSARSDQAFIIGREGLVIPGFSDDATLMAEGFNTPDRIQRERRNRTANRIMVSLTFGESPSASQYSVTYITTDDTGSKEIEPGPAEFLTVGDLQFVYEEARRDSVRRLG